MNAVFKVCCVTHSMDYGPIWAECFTGTLEECERWLESAPGDRSTFRIFPVNG